MDPLEEENHEVSSFTRQIQLKGIRNTKLPCTNIIPRKLKGLLRRKVVTNCVLVNAMCPSATPQVTTTTVAQQSAIAPAEPLFTLSDNTMVPPPVQDLLIKYEFLFKEPTDLPPTRDCDHSIPFLSGAQPVNVRPYRYSPQQKNEIEQRISSMLKSGVISHSSSLFVSPMLLVKKKDGSWRFCIDYRHLNALTVKNKHPLPVLDELLDELSGAKWFTKLTSDRVIIKSGCPQGKSSKWHLKHIVVHMNSE